MGKMGAPRKIDENQFEKLCSIMCTQEEIAGFFDCHIDTVNNFCKREYGMTFSEIYKSKSATGKMSLRRAQFKSAVDRLNPTMLIWLGKQYLGQKEPEKDDTEVLDKLDELLKAQGK